MVSSMLSSFTPRSSEMNSPPVRIEMSFNISLRRSPKPGALTAQARNVPRSLLTTSVANASPSISSAMTRNGLRAADTFSSNGMRSAAAETFFSCRRM